MMLDSFLKCGFWSEIVSSRFLMCVVFPESCWDFVTGPCEICGCSLGLIGIPLLSIRLCSEWFHGRWHGARDRKVKDKRAYPWIVVWSCSCSTPQYSANRSIRKQHQTTSLDRRKLSRFFLGLFQHLHVRCLRNIQRQQAVPSVFGSSMVAGTCF